jgi:hypothetical protein
MAQRTTMSEVIQNSYWTEHDARVVVTTWRRSGTSLTRFARKHGLC